MLRVMDDGDRFASLASSIPCVVTKARLSTNNDIGPLVDLVDKLETKQKYLLVAVPELTNITQLQNKSINFNVVVHHDGNK